MENDKEIGAIYFMKITGFNKVWDFDQNYIEMIENKRYKLNCQASIWNKNTLINLLEPEESPWEFEEVGYKRLINKNFKFFCSSLGSHYESKDNVFNYLVAREFGYGIWKGKWLWNNEKLFRKNSIEVKNIKLEKMSKIQYIIWKTKSKFLQIFMKFYFRE